MAPRTIEQNLKIKDERKEQILVNALKLFARRGLAATKINDIAEVSGFSQGLVYHYFKSKEELFMELVKKGLEESSQTLLQFEALPLEPLEKIRTIARSAFEGLAHQDTAYYFVMMEQASMSESNHEEVENLVRKWKVPVEVIVRIVEEGQRKGQICEDRPEDLAMLFWSTIRGLALRRVLSGEDFKMPDPEIIVRMFPVIASRSE